MITLYSYNRSSAAYRVRIALNLKQIHYKIVEINLLKAEEQEAAYRRINPQGLVPSLEDREESGDNGILLTQSSAIIEYLEEKYPQVAVLPEDAKDRAIVRSMANVIACEIHPLDNLRVLHYLTKELNASETQKHDWYHHWVIQGFKALETILAKHSKGRYCFADSPTLADAFLVPQVYNAHRFNVDMSAFPLVEQINTHCLTLGAFKQAAPKQQPET